jgi:hypothetical protein
LVDERPGVDVIKLDMGRKAFGQILTLLISDKVSSAKQQTNIYLIFLKLCFIAQDGDENQRLCTCTILNFKCKFWLKQIHKIDSMSMINKIDSMSMINKIDSMSRKFFFRRALSKVKYVLPKLSNYVAFGLLGFVRLG